MALPPLELFSLRRELPCCRAALSVYWAANPPLRTVRSRQARIRSRTRHTARTSRNSRGPRFQGRGRWRRTSGRQAERIRELQFQTLQRPRAGWDARRWYAPARADPRRQGRADRKGLSPCSESAWPGSQSSFQCLPASVLQRVRLPVATCRTRTKASSTYSTGPASSRAASDVSGTSSGGRPKAMMGLTVGS